MKKPSVTFLNTILALGMILIFIGFLLILTFAGTIPALAAALIPIFIFVIGLVNVYMYIAFSRSAFKLFAGLFLSLTGAFLLILAFCNLPITFVQSWPCIGLLASFSLFVAARSKKRRFQLSYDLPAIFIFAASVLFLLFSFSLVKISFRDLMLYLFPFGLILAGIFLVVLFFKRKAILNILPEEISKELNKEQNLDDNEDDDSGELL